MLMTLRLIIRPSEDGEYPFNVASVELTTFLLIEV